MSTLRFVLETLQKGIRLWVADGKLRYWAPKDALASEMKDEIVQCKTEIIGLLEEGKIYAFASFAQQRLWFLDRFTPGNQFYNVPFSVRLEGLPDTGTLKKVINEIVNRHETLRTTFATLDGMPIQVILPELNMDIPVIDLHNLSPKEAESEIQRLAVEEAMKPFDLSTGPLMRITLLYLNEREHILLLTMHHIVSDGWSMRILIREITSLYEAFSNGKPSPLPKLPIQYVDFAVWQREKLQGDNLKEQLEYWENRLKGAPSALELLTDYPRPADFRYRGSRQILQLSKELTRELKALSQQEGATLFMVLMAAFSTLLGHYSGQQDIVIGSPIANRNKSDIEGLIGFFVNMLVLRTDLSANPSFRELISRVRDVTIEAYDHQDLPFELLVERLKPERSLNRTPFAQVVFTLQGTPLMEEEKFGDLKISPLTFDIEPVRFDIEFQMWETSEGLGGVLAYNTDLFSGNTMRYFVHYFERLLENCVQNPDRPISDIPLLSDEERYQILTKWNDTATLYSKDKLIHQLFEEQANEAPDAVATVFGDEKLSYGELDRKANQLAHYLQELGVGPNVPVAICMERSLDMLVGLLGILKAGGAYLPLDPKYPSQRLAFMLEDTNTSVLITQSRLLDRLPAGNRRVVCTDYCMEEIQCKSGKNPGSKATADNLAYIIYTSGSTGNPKGVEVCHRPVINLIEWVNRTFKVNPNDRLLFVTSLCFDLSVYDIFGILAAGGSIEIPDETAVRDPQELIRIMCSKPITFWDSAPATLQQIVPFLSSVRPEWEVNNLRLVFLSGDWIPVQLPDLIRNVFPKAEVISLGGATEAVVWSNYYRIGQVDPGWTSIPYGKPIQNARYYILDQYLNPCPIGVAGKLFIGGECLSRGYANRPELTAERFVDDPFNDKPNNRMYDTGDRARFLPDGNIIFMGRCDNQVKIRGFRIELGEIETVLGQHPGIMESIVIIREDEPGDKRLAAYMVLKGGEIPTTGELRTFLGERLPEYMVPSVFVPLEAIPLTPNGKIDRKALSQFRESTPDPNNEFIGPRTPTEKLLSELWAEVLGIDEIGINESFFELGGHSLLVPQVINKIREVFHVELPIRDLFETPTIERLALVILQEQAKMVDTDDLLKMLGEVESI